MTSATSTEVVEAHGWCISTVCTVMSTSLRRSCIDGLARYLRFIGGKRIIPTYQLLTQWHLLIQSSPSPSQRAPATVTALCLAPFRHTMAQPSPQCSSGPLSRVLPAAGLPEVAPVLVAPHPHTWHSSTISGALSSPPCACFGSDEQQHNSTLAMSCQPSTRTAGILVVQSIACAVPVGPIEQSAARLRQSGDGYLCCSSRESMLTRFPSGVRLFGNRILGLLSCGGGGGGASASLSASS